MPRATLIAATLAFSRVASHGVCVADDRRAVTKPLARWRSACFCCIRRKKFILPPRRGHCIGLPLVVVARGTGASLRELVAVVVDGLRRFQDSVASWLQTWFHLNRQDDRRAHWRRAVLLAADRRPHATPNSACSSPNVPICGDSIASSRPLTSSLFVASPCGYFAAHTPTLVLMSPLSSSRVFLDRRLLSSFSDVFRSIPSRRSPVFDLGKIIRAQMALELSHETILWRVLKAGLELL